MRQKADIGLIGLAVMGQNIVLNMNDHEYSVAVYNRTTSRTDEFMADAAMGRETITGTYSLEELTENLEKPRKIMLMVKAGEIVDSIIDSLIPFLDPGDVIIDGGNSRYLDSERRARELSDKGILFVGTGVSGGEEGARRGPSIMPGGNPAAWPIVRNILQDISAKSDDGAPCCEWVGSGGSGHYVKMVHNGIEYGDMQMIGETYDLLHRGLGLSHEEMHDIFNRWNEGDLESYLVEITRDIMAVRDSDGAPLVSRILDRAGQKGTGKWTGIDSLNLAVPVTVIAEAVYSRCLSSMKQKRLEASGVLGGPDPSSLSAAHGTEVSAMVEDIRKALFASKIVSYAQGYMLLREASSVYKWNLNYGEIALMWRGGCIIRSSFLGKIKEAFDSRPDLENLLVDSYFIEKIDACQDGWRRTVARAAVAGIPLPAIGSALAFFDGYRSARLPANLLQAQRDYFGAHTYERTDRPEGEYFHTNWTGTGGNVSSSNYQA
jgi:6-phosphogluconate dehydrogenase